MQPNSLKKSEDIIDECLVDIVPLQFDITLDAFTELGDNLNSFQLTTVPSDKYKTVKKRITDEITLQGHSTLANYVYCLRILSKAFDYNGKMISLLATYINFWKSQKKLLPLKKMGKSKSKSALVSHYTIDNSSTIGFFEKAGRLFNYNDDFMAPIKLTIILHYWLLAIMKFIDDDILVEVAMFITRDPYVNVLKLKSMLGTVKLCAFANTWDDQAILVTSDNVPYSVKYVQKYDVYFSKHSSNVFDRGITEMRENGLNNLAIYCTRFANCKMTDEIVHEFSKVLSLEACIYVNGDLVSILEKQLAVDPPIPEQTDLGPLNSPLGDEMIKTWTEFLSQATPLIEDNIKLQRLQDRLPQKVKYTSSGEAIRMAYRYDVSKTGDIVYKAKGKYAIYYNYKAKKVLVSAKPDSFSCLKDDEQYASVGELWNPINVGARMQAARQKRAIYTVPVQNSYAGLFYTEPIYRVLELDDKYFVGDAIGNVLYDHRNLLKSVCVTDSSRFYTLGDFSNCDLTERWNNCHSYTLEALESFFSKNPALQDGMYADVNNSFKQFGAKHINSVRICQLSEQIFRGFSLAHSQQLILIRVDGNPVPDEDRVNMNKAFITARKGDELAIQYLKDHDHLYRKFSFLTSGSSKTLLQNTITSSCITTVVKSLTLSQMQGTVLISDSDFISVIGDDFVDSLRLMDSGQASYTEGYDQLYSNYITTADQAGIDLRKITIRQCLIEYVKIWFTRTRGFCRRAILPLSSEKPTMQLNNFSRFDSFYSKCQTNSMRGMDPLVLKGMAILLYNIDFRFFKYVTYSQEQQKRIIRFVSAESLTTKGVVFASAPPGLLFAPRNREHMGFGLSKIGYLSHQNIETLFYDERSLNYISDAVSKGIMGYKTAPVPKSFVEQTKAQMPESLTFFNACLESGPYVNAEGQRKKLETSMSHLGQLNRFNKLLWYADGPKISLNLLNTNMARMMPSDFNNINRSYVNALISNGAPNSLDFTGTPRVIDLGSRYPGLSKLKYTLIPLEKRTVYQNGSYHLVYHRIYQSMHHRLDDLYCRLGVSGTKDENLVFRNKISQVLRRDQTVWMDFTEEDVIRQLDTMPRGGGINISDYLLSLTMMGMSPHSASQILQGFEIEKIKSFVSDHFRVVRTNDLTANLDLSEQSVKRLCNVDSLTILDRFTKNVLYELAISISINNNGAFVKFEIDPKDIQLLVKSISGFDSIHIQYDTNLDLLEINDNERFNYRYG